MIISVAFDIVQLRKDGVGHQVGILDLPASRRGAQQQVFRRPCPKGIEAGIDAFRIRPKQGHLIRRSQLQRSLRPRPWAVHARLSIPSQSHGANQLAEFSRPGAPAQVHLEEAFLRMQEPQGAGGIQSVRGVNGGHAQVVALD